MTAVEHLRGPVKGLKSYDKICSHLRHSQEFHDYSEIVYKRLEWANLAGWDFQAGGWDGDSDPNKRKNVAPPNWSMLIDWGKNSDGSDNIEKAGGNVANWTLPLHRICPDDELEAFAEKHWNTPICPTYFCKIEKLLGRAEKKIDKDGKEKTIRKAGANLWAEYARNALREELRDKIERTQDKIRAAMVAALQSPQFEQERVAFHERCIAEEIKTVLLKFSSVAKPHVYKMALDEFIVHEIMES
jgi:hypothetical protein